MSIRERHTMSERRSALSDRLAESAPDLINDLGEEARLFWLYNEQGRERDLFPARIGRVRRPGPYASAFYSAQKWFRRNRTQLVRHIVEDFDYGAKRDLYPRGREAALVVDLAAAIAPACEKPHPVDPVLASAVIVRIGLDVFCEGYGENNIDDSAWSLERALGIDPTKASELAEQANRLLNRGHWKRAVPLLEKALLLCPFHLIALNDITYIYGCYYPKCPEGLEFARQLYRWTVQGDANEPQIFDTIGWAGFRHGGNIDLCEDCLKYALKELKPLETGYVSVGYHLMAVLDAQGKAGEARDLFDTLKDLPVTNPLDEESLRLARALVTGSAGE